MSELAIERFSFPFLPPNRQVVPSGSAVVLPEPVPAFPQPPSLALSYGQRL